MCYFFSTQPCAQPTERFQPRYSSSHSYCARSGVKTRSLHRRVPVSYTHLLKRSDLLLHGNDLRRDLGKLRTAHDLSLIHI